MLYIHLAAVWGLALFGFGFYFMNRKKSSPEGLIPVLFGLALLVRIIIAQNTSGFDVDISCFAFWADRIFQVGPSGFYSPDVFTDYPPGYIYLLYPLGALRSLLEIEAYSQAHLLLLKLPAILCDIGCGALLYREASRKLPGQYPFFLCLAWLFQPAVILNSCVWGQIDSIYVLLLALMCVCLIRGKMFFSYAAFFLGLIIKPQTLIFAPVLLAGILDHVFLKDFSAKKLLKNLAQGLTALAIALLLCLPFGLEKVVSQYLDTLGSYPYAAVNANNFWGFLGLNWVSQENTFLGISYQTFGMIFIAAAVILVLFLGVRNKRDTEKYPFLAALLMASVFVFSVRMHERYLYPVMLLLLLSFVYKPSRQIFLCCAGFSVMHFYNTADVFFYYDADHYNGKAPLVIAVSAGMLICLFVLYRITVRLYLKKEQLGETDVLPAPGQGAGFAPRPSRPSSRLCRADWICMLVITALYSCFALYDLGDRQAPDSALEMTRGDSLTFDFGQEIPQTLSYYIAPWHDRTFSLEGKRTQDEPWVSLGSISLKNVFTWQEIRIEAQVPILRLTLLDAQASILEFAFTDKDGNLICPQDTSSCSALFDEQALVPKRSTFRNSMYFDEIYHARTAWEFLNGHSAYENTHPPLGKSIISAGVALFGMNPFGWRIMGVLFGIAMVPVVYLFAKKLTQDTASAALACVLFTFDFMHFAQTRLATIDVFITFFVILMYYLMYQYSRISFYDTPLPKTFLPLGACGICMGLGIACKWTGVYAGAGLAVIFFRLLYRRYEEYRYAIKDPSGQTEGIPHSRVISSFLPCTVRTLLFCLVFFAAIPALIYLLSYLPFQDQFQSGLLARMLRNQETMFSYHSTLVDTHDYSSYWYQWPIMQRPIWYYSGIVSNTVREGISSFGNPLVWWMGIPAALYTFRLWTKKKDSTAAFLFIGYLAQYLPWFFVSRITFIYHYFPSVVFLVLMIVHSFRSLGKNLPRRRFLLCALLYGAAVLGMFLLFYPVLAGQPIDGAFVDKYLRWFPSWTLISW